MPILEIPLTPTPQTFNILLAGVEYRFTLLYRDVSEGGWTLDIADGGGARMVSGLSLVAGADLLAQHRHLGIGGGLFIQSEGDPDAVPGFADLGTTCRLYFVPTA